MTPLAKVIELTLANAPKLVVSMLAVVVPTTVMAVTWVSPAMFAAFATDTPVIVKPVLANLPFAFTYSA